MLKKGFILSGGREQSARQRLSLDKSISRVDQEGTCCPLPDPPRDRIDALSEQAIVRMDLAFKGVILSRYRGHSPG